MEIHARSAADVRGHMAMAAAKPPRVCQPLSFTLNVWPPAEHVRLDCCSVIAQLATRRISSLTCAETAGSRPRRKPRRPGISVNVHAAGHIGGRPARPKPVKYGPKDSCRKKATPEDVAFAIQKSLIARSREPGADCPPPGSGYRSVTPNTRRSCGAALRTSSQRALRQRA